MERRAKMPRREELFPARRFCIVKVIFEFCDSFGILFFAFSDR